VENGGKAFVTHSTKSTVQPTQSALSATMTAFFFKLVTPLLAMARVTSSYQASPRRTLKVGNTATHSRLNLGRQKQEDDGIIVVHPHPPSSTVRPILLTASVTTAAALFTYSMPSHAAESFDMSSVNYLNNEALSVIHPDAMTNAVLSNPDQHSNTVKSFTSVMSSSSSSLLLSRSTMVNPIGELKDGSENSAEISFGQWFFVVYIVVSLVAGGKEMMRRIQKQMDDNA
jgi:hypothetical protein